MESYLNKTVRGMRYLCEDFLFINFKKFEMRPIQKYCWAEVLSLGWSEKKQTKPLFHDNSSQQLQ